LGSVWLGVYPVESHVKNLRALLEIPEEVVPLSIISLGYPDEQKEPVDRYSEGKVHWNRW
jgi:nitroreductase